MNYRHAYHAGNFADVFKHAILALVLEHAKLKPAPFCVLDTHAGIGRYDLQSPEAGKTGEWRKGIGRLLGPDADPIPAVEAGLLAPFLDVVRSENAEGGLSTYPGSPLLARRLLRAQDRLVAAELHPEDCAALSRCFARDPQTRIMEIDGWLALKASLPPRERRGVILVDPPYEARDEMQSMLDGLAAAVRRFVGGTYLLWYPIKDTAQVERFHDALQALEISKILRAEILIREPLDTHLLNGCGLMIVNPPWTLADRLEALLPFLAERLAVAPGSRQAPQRGSRHRIQWLAP
jgi:23S rRNA (adenine2030-N6)-methyltransferase